MQFTFQLEVIFSQSSIKLAYLVQTHLFAIKPAAITTVKTGHMPTSALKPLATVILSASILLAILIAVLYLSASAPIDSFLIYLMQLLSIRVKPAIYM